MFKYDPQVYTNSAHGYGLKYAERITYVSSEGYLRRKFPAVFDNHPRDGYENTTFGKQAIGVDHLLDGDDLRRALGWTVKLQLKGYYGGAIRRLSRSMRDT
jgi:hypothetical protein